MNFGLKDNVALVTGGSHGIGRATALALAREGCSLVICARGRENLNSTKADIEFSGSKCIAVQGDVTEQHVVDEIFDKTISQFGTLHILVNNVGGGGRWGKEDVVETKERVWTEVYEKNVLTAIRFTTKFLPYMQKQNWGRVISITSRLAKDCGGRPWFNMAKASMTVMMKNLSAKKEFSQKNITFNSVAPGDIMIPDTVWYKEQLNNPNFEQMVKDNYATGRLGCVREVADVVAFLCSEQASYVNGAVVAVDGGQSIGI